MGNSYRFTVPGNPIPKARARVVNGHSYTPKRTTDHEALVRAYALGSGVRASKADLSVKLTFYRADHRRVDVDNLGKCVLDGLNRIAWHDDTQITELIARKAYDKDNPRTEVQIDSLS